MVPTLSELDRLYSQITKVKSRLESAVSLLEFGTSGDARHETSDLKKSDISTAKQQQLSGLANQLSRHNEEIKKMYKEVRPQFHHQQQSTWDRRLEKLSEDTKLLVLSVDKALGYMSVRHAAEQDRERLLDNSSTRRRDKYKNMTNERLMEDESRRLDDSSVLLASMIQQGAQTIMNLQSQKKILKSTVAKMKGAAISLGVSASLISAVENRFRSDRLLTYGGIIVVSLFLYVFYHWWKGYDMLWWFPYRIIGRLLSVIFSVFRASKPTSIDENVG
eukprot:Gregarina_sp_Pseudo_9__2509@NODE_2786_length_875_cov_5_595694_g2549_i0_p1_GENE_NODE_2786_length_875_cov_5_595694_g2549_i0NODE_2786_length_875_cov_5_595694_g2549_i0_p1_ORF_typecomplete_len276_score26_00VSNARE_C/PF12352_8/4_6e03VSNARE_C/PF12352_8/3e02VSNARE_C/PF12352_8/8_3e11Sec20/PF03908_13/1_4e03Sec20/PF03908_13/4_5e08NACHT_N/PF17100_5/1_7e03NACHT_N/PF17100_5/0_021Soyouz_module/PF14313_6/0_049DUF1031/PF06275_11/0_053DUF1031/PF06275_11/2_8e03PHM7_cyt/PF14703_6/0_19TNFR_16_TM/PF18422_1/0_22_NODE_2